MFIKLFILSLLITSFGYAGKIKIEDLKRILWLRYESDTTKISVYLSSDFEYLHPAVIGLGINVIYDDGSFLITENFRKDSIPVFSVSDRINEINNEKIKKNSILPKGPIGSMHKIILTKKGDSTFIKKDVPLIESKYREDKNSFLKSIKSYSDSWYDFHIDIYEVLIQKNKAFLYYRWEGSQESDGEVYSFFAMELITLDKKRNYIKSIETIWTKSSFMNQFLH